MRKIVEETEALLPPGAWPAWTGSNHDMSRLASRWAGNDPRKIRAALVMLLTLRGTPVLYQGDEIGLGDVTVPHELMRDPLGVRYMPHYAGRDAMRTPMHWRDTAGGGFTAPGTTPWLPLGDTSIVNVESQRSDPDSVLELTRALIVLRREQADLHSGSYETIAAPDGVWAWRRGASFEVVMNMTDEEAEIANVTGRVRIGSDRSRDGESVSGSVTLRPWEALVVQR